jgi:hypothetical protein
MTDKNEQSLPDDKGLPIEQEEPRLGERVSAAGWGVFTESIEEAYDNIPNNREKANLLQRNFVNDVVADGSRCIDHWIVTPGLLGPEAKHAYGDLNNALRNLSIDTREAIAAATKPIQPKIEIHSGLDMLERPWLLKETINHLASGAFHVNEQRTLQPMKNLGKDVLQLIRALALHHDGLVRDAYIAEKVGSIYKVYKAVKRQDP